MEILERIKRSSQNIALDEVIRVKGVIKMKIMNIYEKYWIMSFGEKTQANNLLLSVHLFRRDFLKSINTPFPFHNLHTQKLIHKSHRLKSKFSYSFTSFSYYEESSKYCFIPRWLPISSATIEKLFLETIVIKHVLHLSTG